MKKFLVSTVLLFGPGSFFLFAMTLQANPPAKHTMLDQPQVKEVVMDLKELLSNRSWDQASLKSTGDKITQSIGTDHYVSQRLVEIVDTESLSPEDQEKAIAELHESLTFRPLIEAEVPKGFPEFTPLHQIEVKRYPAYRLARVSMNEAASTGAFFTLFNHIKRNNIAMTAPVQVDYDSGTDNRQAESMAFLYGNTGIGSLGVDPASSNVEVLEIPEQLVVSIGMRGAMTEEAVKKAHLKLKTWLEQHQEDYGVSGPLRRMGYNSPFVPRERKYYEVQIPIVKR